MALCRSPAPAKTQDMHEPVELSYAKCRELLGGGVLGRVALCTPDHPVVLPVNYSVVNESIVFRTSPYSVIAGHDWSRRIAFEVDHFDYEDHKGWSVLAVGRGSRVEEPDEIAAIRRSADPRPWAAGQRNLYMKVVWRDLSGRRIGGDWSPTTMAPVHRAL